MLWNALLMSLRELRRNKLRSFLTMLGIVIGVAAVIVMVTVGKGATVQVTQQIQSLGSNLLQVRTGQRGHGPGGVRAASKLFKLEDAKAIYDQISGLAAVSPVASSSSHAIYGNTNWLTTITGSTNEYLRVRDWSLLAGRSFTDTEERVGKMVCVIGSTVRTQLFGARDPIGEIIRIGKLSCQVIGVLKPKGQSGFGRDQDDFLLIPLRAFQRRIAGNNNIDAIYVSAQDGVSTEKVKRDMERLMRERRRIPSGEEDDFHVNDMKEIVQAITGTTQVLTQLLGAVAAVSLLVGGIGIMNIMLVSVTERTREIGIRLAIGALEREVMLQFLVEAIVLSSFGGMFGILLAITGSYVLTSMLNVPFVLGVGIIIVAFLFSAGVGVMFGYFPARKAAHLNPIDALRHE